MQINMAIEFFHNSKILHFLGIKSEIYQSVQQRSYDFLSLSKIEIASGAIKAVEGLSSWRFVTAETVETVVTETETVFQFQ